MPGDETHSDDPSSNPSITFVGHSTVLVELAGRRLLTDPMLTSGVAHVRRVADPVPPSTTTSLDMVLLSHLHHDHLHVPSLRRITRNVPVAVPKGGARYAARAGFDDIVEVVAGDRLHIGDVTVEVVPARHDDRRTPLWGRAEPVGYVIEGDGTSCYFAGDTDLFDDMQSFTGRIGMALLPVWGWGPTLGHGHLDPERAGMAVDIIRPDVVVPIHWGTLWPLFTRRHHRHRLSAPPHEFAQALAPLDVTTDVRIVAPGGSVPIG
jgi:L-ascorbate metabolism protein UlaG (beta-lactamase superfamily)